jgi:hypothetical protein
MTMSLWERIFLAIFAIIGLVVVITIAFYLPHPSQGQWYVFITVLALAGAGISAFLPGAIDWQVTSGLKAGGALAIFLVIFFYGRRVDLSDSQVKRWALVPPPTGIAPDVNTAAIYVDVDDHIVKEFGADKLSPIVVDMPNRGSGLTLDRGKGGMVVNTKDIRAGTKLLFIVEDKSKWWISDDIDIPPNFSLDLREIPLDAVKKRVPEVKSTAARSE